MTTTREEQEEAIKPFRDQIRHEDTLFNQRITWLMTFQGFLIVPFLLVESSSNKTQLVNIQIIIVSIGILSAFLVFLGCFAAHQSINYLINSARINLCMNKEAVKGLLMRNPRYIQIAGAFPSFGSIILLSIVWIFLLQNINSIDSTYKVLLIIIAGATALSSLITLICIIFQTAIPSQITAKDIVIEKIYAGILVTIALYLIITITYLAMLILNSSFLQWWSIPIFVVGGLFWGGILFLILKIES